VSEVTEHAPRDGALIAGLLTAAAWALLIGRVAGMDTGPGGDPGAVGWFAGTWAAMTAAMMLPASAHAVLLSARAWRRRAAFFAGYFAVWMLAGLVGYGLVAGTRGLSIGALAWSSAGRYVAGAAVAAAGVYQLSGAKRRWLARCRAPRRSLEGADGARALLAGAEHGGCCVACCWTLIAALYALGMMSVTWMALVTILIAGERLLPRPVLALRAVAVTLLVLGVAVAARPAAVPGLTIPPAGRSATMGMAGLDGPLTGPRDRGYR
jgi:predicted metal-binding membrane protein